MENANAATVTLEGSTSSLIMVSPENLTPHKFDGNVVIASQSLVVIMEN